MAGVIGSPSAQLPPLREDLELIRGPVLPDGAPSWHLCDRARNKFFRIGWRELEILRRWHLADPERISAAVSAETSLHVLPEQVKDLLQFLIQHQLLISRGKAAIDHLCRLAEQGRPKLGQFLLHKYLFFRFRLFRPDAFLEATLPWVNWIFSRASLIAFVVLALLGLFLAGRQWEGFLTTFLQFQTWEAIALIGIALLFAKFVHELGHAYAAKRYGLHVPELGVAVLVLWPVLYTETSDAWRLVERKQRLVVGMAGMVAELGLAVLAVLAWSLLPDGPLRSVAFLLGTTTWVLTLLINLNPMMRFDGYYLLSDLLEVQNLQERAFALGRWRLRRFLLGLDQAPPEYFKPRLRRALLLYCWSTWIYRFFLFLGIALLVYYFFFKLLGVFLMLVELTWFLARPVYRELREWYRMRGEIRMNWRLLRFILVLCGVVALLIIPWRGHTHLPALASHQQHAKLHTPQEARLVDILVSQGDQVETGQALARLESLELEQRIGQARREREITRLDLERRDTNTDYRQGLLISRQRLAEIESDLIGLRQERDRLTISAPFTGRVSYLAPGLTPGRWLSDGFELLQITAPQALQLTAYADEDDVRAIAPDASGRFYPKNTDLDPFDVRIVDIEQANTPYLDKPYLGSVYGGPIAVRATNDRRLAVDQAIFHLKLEPVGRSPAINQVTPGEIRLRRHGESLVSLVWRRLLSLLLRESGF